MFFKHKSFLAASFLFLFVFAVFKMFTLNTAFHVDTMIYVNGVKSLMTSGKLPVDFFFFHRIVNVWLYLPFFLFFEMNGIAWVTILLYLLFGFFYVSFLSKGFGRLCALFSFLLVSFAPATLITVTHLKEDYNAMLFCFISLGLAISFYRNVEKYSAVRQYVVSAMTGLFFGLGLLCKETLVFAFIAPFSFILFSGEKKLFNKTKIVNIFAMLFCFCLGVLVLCPDYIDQVLKLVSGDEFYRITVFSLKAKYWKFALGQMGKGFYMWWVLLPGFFYAVYVLIRQRKFMLLVFPFMFFVYLFFLGGSNGFWLRLTVWVLVWSVPVSVYGFLSFADVFCGTVKKNVQVVVFFLFLVASFFNFKHVYPLLDLRKNINFMETFYTNCLDGAPDGSVVIGMDNLDVLAFFEGDRFVYKKHSINVTEKEVDDFIAGLKEDIASGKRVFMLPDFFSYSENFEKYFQQQVESSFYMHESYTGLYSFYHRMDYFMDYDTYLEDLVQKRNVDVIEEKDEGIILLNDSGDKLEIKEISLKENTGEIFSFKVFFYKGVLVPLTQKTLFEFKLKK